ncbi:hypothetical protein D9M72_616780 [compost metagenome]
MSHDQTFKVLADGRYEFRATVVESQQLRWWLRGFGVDLELKKPLRLLDRTRPEARRRTIR